MPVSLPKFSNDRIIGGRPTSIQQYPFVVQIFLPDRFLCGGSLLTLRHVLSAAHCFENTLGILKNPKLFTVHVGGTKLYAGTEHQVSAIVLHENYKSKQLAWGYDISVLLLETDVTLSSNVATVNIPEEGASVPDNATVIVVGWGTTNPNSKLPSYILNEVAIKTINWEICEKNYAMVEREATFLNLFKTDMMCAGIQGVGGKDACFGDSGGPLLYNGVVVGITSWGVGCAEAQYPGVFTKVSKYTNWIIYTIQHINGTSSVYSIRVTLAIPFLLLMISVTSLWGPATN
ncbi:unnamed protein product [Spodoptera exigua]|nr:unnamed protein product [Spodoptera exigua]